MSRLGLGGGGSESYPKRPDEPDCVYYLRTGVCGYGSKCQFNHPPNRPPVNKYHWNRIYDFNFLLMLFDLDAILVGIGRSQNRSWRGPREDGTTRLSGFLFDLYRFHAKYTLIMLLNKKKHSLVVANSHFLCFICAAFYANRRL